MSKRADSPIRPNKYCVNVNKCDATWYARASARLASGEPTESICRPDDGRLMYRRTGAPLDLFSPRASACRSSLRLVLLNFVFPPESFLRHEESLSRSLRLDGSKAQ